jgi:hypothetical protein
MLPFVGGPSILLQQTLSASSPIANALCGSSAKTIGPPLGARRFSRGA